MVIDAFDLVRTRVRPNEANTPLLIHPDTVLARAIAF